MPLQFVSEPPNGESIVHNGLERIASRTGHPLGGIDPRTTQITSPHTVYDLRADRIARGDGLDSASVSAIRYLIEAAGQCIAAAEVLIDITGTATLLANVNYGNFAVATHRAFQQLAVSPEVPHLAYEVRLLRFSAIYLMAIWLKASGMGSDIVYPLAPAPPGIQAEKLYSETELLKALLPLAQKRAAPRMSTKLP